MIFLYGLIALACLIFGIMHLFVFHTPNIAIHYLLIGLFCYVMIFEFMRRPFSRSVYVITTVLLVIEGLVQLFFLKGVIEGIISLFLGLSMWQSQYRLRKK